MLAAFFYLKHSTAGTQTQALIVQEHSGKASAGGK